MSPTLTAEVPAHVALAIKASFAPKTLTATQYKQSAVRLELAFVSLVVGFDDVAVVVDQQFFRCCS